ncbi:MAG: helicase-related protein [Romboutsia timonensis]
MTTLSYDEFIKSKYLKTEKSGFDYISINNLLFDYQKDLVKWALKLGKSAIFANTGLGKTFIQLEWAKNVFEYTNKPVLILAPLAVSSQTIEESKKIGIDVKYCKEQSDVIKGINITNYERLENFNSDEFIGIVLDESSILKSFTGKYRQMIIDNFKYTPYKLACSATPAPNDYMELGNHSEFLNQMTRTEMLSMFFYHDGGNTSKWRLKGHAENRFWEWVSSWAAIVKNPEDLGYDGCKHKLPILNEQQLTVKTEWKGATLFALPAKTLEERREARRDSLNDRCQLACDLVTQNIDKQWLIWCDLNDEANLLNKLIPESTNVQGSDKPEIKAERLLDFGKGNIKCLITKPKIASFGLNWQTCHNMIFVGLSDSYESYYQAVRRCYRFGQKEQVNVYIITSDREQNVLKNIQRKQFDFEKMQKSMVDFTKKYVRDNLEVTFKELDKNYKASVDMILPEWLKSEV